MANKILVESKIAELNTILDIDCINARFYLIEDDGRYLLIDEEEHLWESGSLNKILKTVIFMYAFYCNISCKM